MSHDLLRKLTFLGTALQVTRCHTEPVRKQTIGEHSCGVALFAFLLTEGRPSADLLLACLTHDLGERRWGDMPGNVKEELGLRARIDVLENATLVELGFDRAGVSYPDRLIEHEVRVLNLADKYDLLLFCCLERARGNQLVQEVWLNTASAVQKFKPFSNTEAELHVALKQLWKTYDGDRT